MKVFYYNSENGEEIPSANAVEMSLAEFTEVLPDRNRLRRQGRK
jgi:hypothetical protein